MERSRLARLGVFLTALGFSFATGGAPAWGHDTDPITTSFSCLGSGGGCPQQTDHEDDGPFKGWVDLTVSNTGSASWTGFHFEIVEVMGYDITNVDFDVTGDEEPTSSQSGLSWVVDNSAYGATLQLYFGSDPVLPLETAWFKVYTDNTVDQVDFFGVLYYPTPEPGTFLLFGAGLIWMAGLRRRAASRARKPEAI